MLKWSSRFETKNFLVLGKSSNLSETLFSMRFFLVFSIAFLLITVPSCKKDSNHRIQKYHRQEVGSSARDILSDKHYKTLSIEIIYMTGFRPEDQSIENLKQLITSICNKPDGINVIFSEIPAQGKSAYSLDDVRELEKEYRTQFTFKKDLAVSFLFLDGPSSDDQGNSMVLGQAYYNTSMVIYEKSLQDNAGGFGQPSLYKLETTVINHEFGHILGLVNLGSTMYSLHQDTPHGSHCDNTNCLMYWEAETGSVFSNLIGNSPIPVFDSNCLRDLHENGGK
jgi:predicted Zn-dependent protease